MTVLLEATLDRKSARFALELRDVQERAAALKKRHPHLQLVVGHRQVGSKLHLVVAAATAPHRRRAVVATENRVERG